MSVRHLVAGFSFEFEHSRVKIEKKFHGPRVNLHRQISFFWHPKTPESFCWHDGPGERFWHNQGVKVTILKNRTCQNNHNNLVNACIKIQIVVKMHKLLLGTTTRYIFFFKIWKAIYSDLKGSHAHLKAIICVIVQQPISKHQKLP